MTAQTFSSSSARSSSRSKYRSLKKNYLGLTWREKIPLERILRNTSFGGSVGSGKSIAQATLMRSSMEMGDGMAILCSNDEIGDAVERMAWSTGREDDLKRVTVNGEWRCNLISYELERSGSIDDAFQLAWTGIEINDRGTVGKANDPFFDRGGKEILRHGSQVVYAAFGTLDIGRVLQIVRTHPTSPGAIEEDPERFAVIEYLALARKRFKPGEKFALDEAERFFHGLASLNDRTKSSLAITAEIKLSLFWNEIIHGLFFDGESNWNPDFVLGGGILLFDVAFSRYQQISSSAGAMVKEAIQRAALRRDMSDYDSVKTVSIWADDCTSWLTAYDIMACERGRKNKLWHAFSWQGRISVESAYGGGFEGKSHASALLLNFNTHFMFGQTDAAERQANADMIGKHEEDVITHRGRPDQPAKVGGESYTPAERHWVPERVWIGLKNGSGRDGIVEAILFTGQLFKDRKPYKKVRFFRDWIPQDDDGLFAFYPRAPLSVWFGGTATCRSWARHISIWRFVKTIWRDPHRFKEMWFKWLAFWLDIPSGDLKRWGYESEN